MNQVKNNIIDKIILLEDKKVINALDQILDNLNTPENKKLSSEEKALLLLGLEDYKNGDVISDEEVRKSEEKWLNK